MTKFAHVLVLNILGPIVPLDTYLIHMILVNVLGTIHKPRGQLRGKGGYPTDHLIT